jgi:hypothetical protein
MLVIDIREIKYGNDETMLLVKKTDYSLVQ